MADIIKVQGTAVAIKRVQESDYISLTDIARHKDAEATDDLIRSWLRNRNTLEFVGMWEQLNNPDFKPVEFDGFRKQAGLNLENLNALFITQGMAQSERLQKLNAIAIQQMKLLINDVGVKDLGR